MQSLPAADTNDGRLLQEANDLLVGVSLLHVRHPLGDGLYLNQPGPENGGQVTTPETGATEDPLKPRDISGTLPTSVAAGQSAPVVTVNGGVEYGCGGTTGTACFLLVGDGASYVISMLHDTSDAMTEKLNSAIQSQSCIEVTGRLSPDKMGVFFAFSPGQQVGINECSQEQALADQPVNSDWFEIGRTTDVTMNLKTSTFRRTGQGTADSAACILGQMLTSKGSLLNQYCVYERDCVAGYGTIYIQEVDFRPSSSASFGVGAKGSASVTAEFLCNAINVTKR